VLAGLGEAALDDQVVEGDRLRVLRQRAVLAQFVGHPVEAVEDAAVAPVELRQGGGEGRWIESPPTPITSLKKRWKKTEWRTSSTCWVARKYCCSSVGAAVM
jgi:hypothetical protein